MRVRDLLDLANEADISFHSSFAHAQKAELGIALHKQRGRIIGRHKIVRLPLRDGIAQWQLVEIAKAPPPTFGEGAF
jgi:hypothetical protein